MQILDSKQYIIITMGQIKTINAQYFKHRRTSDSLNKELPIELVSNKIIFYHEKDSRFNH